MTDRRSFLSGALALLGAPAADAAAPARAPLPIGDSVVVGMRHQAAAPPLDTLRAGARLLLRREPSNPHDPDAIAVHAPDGPRLGYIPARDAPRLAAMMDAGAALGAELMEDGAEGASALALRLELVDAVARPALPAPDPGLAMLVRAAPLMAEFPGGMALMVTGPALGWRRSTAGRWWPPGPGAWPEMPEEGPEALTLGDGTAALDEIAATALARGMALPVPPATPPWQGHRAEAAA